MSPPASRSSGAIRHRSGFPVSLFPRSQHIAERFIDLEEDAVRADNSQAGGEVFESQLEAPFSLTPGLFHRVVFRYIQPVAQRQPVAPVFEIGDLLSDPLFLTLAGGYLELVTGVFFVLFEEGGHVLLGHLAVAGVDQPLIILAG